MARSDYDIARQYDAAHSADGFAIEAADERLAARPRARWRCTVTMPGGSHARRMRDGTTRAAMRVGNFTDASHYQERLLTGIIGNAHADGSVLTTFL